MGAASRRRRGGVGTATVRRRGGVGGGTASGTSPGDPSRNPSGPAVVLEPPRAVAARQPRGGQGRARHRVPMSLRLLVI
eukprot:1789551-Pyramimonas_sp.AAC.1